MGVLDQVVGTLQRACVQPQVEGALLGVVRWDGELDLRIPPAAALQSPRSFLCMVGAGLRDAAASAVGLVLPVRTVWGEERVCPYLDAEALALVAVEDLGDGVVSAGMICPIHALPTGWEEAQERLQSIARPLRLMLADRPLEEEEVV
jgi:hypothetical protein